MKATATHSPRIAVATGHSLKAAILSLALLVAGCGAGGGGSAPAAINSVPAPAAQQAAANSFTITSDSYGMKSATYLAATKSSLGIVLRSAIASSMTDVNFRTVARIDIPTPGGIGTGATYFLGPAAAGAPVFPGSINFFNGDQSTQLKTVGGTITFRNFGSATGDRISGSFSVTVEDGNAVSAPRPSYSISADFDFITDSFGPALPTVAPRAASAL